MIEKVKLRVRVGFKFSTRYISKVHQVVIIIVLFMPFAHIA